MFNQKCNLSVLLFDYWHCYKLSKTSSKNDHKVNFLKKVVILKQLCSTADTPSNPLERLQEIVSSASFDSSFVTLRWVVFEIGPKSRNCNFNDREPYFYHVTMQKNLGPQFLLKTSPHQTPGILKIKSAEILKRPTVYPSTHRPQNKISHKSLKVIYYPVTVTYINPQWKQIRNNSVLYSKR